MNDLLKEIHKLKKENQKLKRQLRDIEKIIFGKKEVKPPPPETEEMATSSENGNTENP
jgi:regulator of replication initiation timing